MTNERDERLVSVDPAYARQVQALRDRTFGTDPTSSNGQPYIGQPSGTPVIGVPKPTPRA